MKLRALLVLTALVSLVYGVAFVLAPGQPLALYGITTGPGELLMGRFYGAALLGFAMLAWSARNVIDAAAQRAVVLGFLVFTVIGLVISVRGTLAGTMSGVGWSAAAIFLVFALGFGYFQAGRAKPASTLR